MKKWPEKNKTVSFTELKDHIREAILFAYNIKRKNKNRIIPWKGYDIGEDTKITSFSPDERFRVHNMKYSEEDQGRDALDEILAVAIQLGIEQGRRIFITSSKYSLLKSELKMIKNFILKLDIDE